MGPEFGSKKQIGMWAEYKLKSSGRANESEKARLKEML